MKRTDYQKPTMKVVKLQHHGMLMESGEVKGRGNIRNWEKGDDTNDEVYM